MAKEKLKKEVNFILSVEVMGNPLIKGFTQDKFKVCVAMIRFKNTQVS